ncbi:MAG: phosphate butyryltransferase, partial [Tannerellaceae bacterium]|nr:phosphate butyryltransferase [Tannerellaceae bacterium]
MKSIKSFAELTAHLKGLKRRRRVAVVCANDPNTEYAISRAHEEGIAEFLMVGDPANPDEAAREAVRMVNEGEADILMKGIINTDNLLHAILDKEK